jgi:leucyl-tRNA synthetase
MEPSPDKRINLRKIQNEMQERWKDHRAEPSDSEKYFITFPYPYMNGRLHLGHGYSLTKAEFTARYQKLLGKNVLFPFAFHCTGMPIQSSAVKLQNDDPNQIAIMKNMGINSNDIDNFKDPNYWLEYFPKFAMQDLKKFGCCIDFRRSFITTEKNPFYSSFVRWQFNKLRELEKIFFSDRYVIYSPIDKQPCTDHGRASGEGVKPSQYKLFKQKCKGASDEKSSSDDKLTYFVSKTNIKTDSDLGLYDMKDGFYICTEEIATNLSYQNHTHEFGVAKKMSSVRYVEFDLGAPVTYIDYYEPGARVVSRSGNDCVVASVSQWFLGYNDAKWTNKVLDHISTMETYNSHVKEMLLHGAQWLKEWGCSRIKGLGTRLPWDDKLLIESLSDSTIYMAYYTIAHHLHPDSLDGSGSNPLGIKPEDMTDDVWEYIMGKGDDTKHSKYNPLKDEFNYWYPVNLRVSGKDLIRNHLLMFLFNHAAIFPEQMPKAIFTNGHIKVDNVKMSKQVGNFVTLDQAIDTYSADAIRIALADSGDAMEDGNFDNKVAGAAIRGLDTYIKLVGSIFNNKQLSQENDLLDDTLELKFYDLLKKVKSSYDNMEFRNVLKYAWYEMTSAFNTYLKDTKGKINKSLTKELFIKQMIVMTPIAPHTFEYLLETYACDTELKFPEIKECEGDAEHYYQYYKSFSINARKEMSKFRKRNKTTTANTLTVIIKEQYDDLEQKIIRTIKTKYDESKEFPSNLVNEFKEQFDKTELNKCMRFYGFIKQKFPVYGEEIFDKPYLPERKILEINRTLIIEELKLQDMVINSDYTQAQRCEIERCVVRVS